MSTSLPVLNEPTELTNATDIIEGATDLLEGPTDLGERADISNDENLNEMATEEEHIYSNTHFITGLLSVNEIEAYTFNRSCTQNADLYV